VSERYGLNVSVEDYHRLCREVAAGKHGLVARAYHADFYLVTFGGAEMFCVRSPKTGWLSTCLPLESMRYYGLSQRDGPGLHEERLPPDGRDVLQ
jgi:hypothetical protein